MAFGVVVRVQQTCLHFWMRYFTEVIDSGGGLDAIFLDFAKAFDKVPHGRLLAKLRAHGFDGHVVAWIEAWLRPKDRKSSGYVLMDRCPGGVLY